MLDRIAELLIFGFTPLMIGMLIGPTAPKAAEHALRGEVVYRERIALPANAVLSVRLSDVSLADAPAAVVGEQTIDPAGQAPIPFEIRLDPSVIVPNMHYVLQARITVDDKLWFITDSRHEVDPLSGELQTVRVSRVDGSARIDGTGIYDRDWKVELVDGIVVLPTQRATFRVERDGRIGGKGFCNGYFASAEIDDGTISIGQAGATELACAPNLMVADAALFDAFGKAASFRADAESLAIADGEGRDVLRFSPM